MRYEEIYVGQVAEMSKTITEFDVYGFAGITGDFNPAHVDKVKAEAGMFKARIAHGMLGAGLISAVLGMKLPAEGTIYLGQELKFKAPVYIGDTVTARVEVLEKKDKNKIIILKTEVVNQEGKVVIEGKATVMKPE